LSGKITNPSQIFNLLNDGYSPTGDFFFGTSSATYHGFLSGDLWLDGSLSGVITSQSIGILNSELWLSGNADGSVTNNIGNLSGEVGGLDGLMIGKYDFNVSRPLTCVVSAELKPAQYINYQVVALQQATERIQCQLDTGIMNADSIAVCIDSVINKVDTIYSVLTVDTDNALLISARLSSSVGNTAFLSTAINSIVEQATALSISLESIQDVLLFIHQQAASINADCGTTSVAVLKDFYKAVNLYTPNSIVSFTTENYQPSGNFLFDSHELIILRDAMFKGVLTKETLSSAVTSVLISKHQCSLIQSAKYPDIGKSPHIDLPRPPPVIPPQHSGTVTIPTREVYSVQHIIDVKTVIGNHAVPLSKISLSYDVDSFSWLFSGVLADKSSLSLVTMTNDEPVQLSITINGHNWIVLVEKIPEVRSFGKTDITLTGRSLSALLGAPYQRLASYTAGSDMTVQQIADALLPIGWTIDWQCATPWLIPANTFSYTQQTPLQALATVAQNIGAALVPSRNAQVLTMQPRYPVLPWNFYAVGINPDLVIPDAAIKSIGTESRTQSPINAVYVHGEIGGVLSSCRLTGTAGDVLAATESNVLMTDVVGARALGERILAGHATQPVTTSFTTFLGGDFPLAEVGRLVAVNGERAIINGVSIDVEFGKVSQQITLGEQTTNAYSKLMNLLPSQPLLVGQCIASQNDVSVLTLLDGGVITARGTGVAGLNYYVRNGLIESAAPNLASSEIVI
jgi:hypothetical protein